MSFQANQAVYMQMMSEFCDGMIRPMEFVDKYFALWHKDIDEDYKITQSWDRRYDIDLQEQFKRGEINGEEFSKKYRELHGYTELEWEIQSYIGRTFTACDCYWEDIPDEELDPPLVINAEMLRTEVRD
ncbi:MAG: hypothetical protein ACRC2T_17325, partial [Thermoguttaceae bacterium]